jgi:ubiquinone/menaquinone biosynthesis C-methylase UbiE
VLAHTSLRFSYTLIAPFYDAIVANATAGMRQRSLAYISQLPELPQQVLINGAGSGLDLPYLPIGPRYTALDLNPSMLARARKRVGSANVTLDLGDAMQLPYPDASFDLVILHLIVAVTPQPTQTLLETTRVLRPNGHILVMDKFLKPGQTALLRRALSPFVGLLASKTNVVWEDLFSEVSQQLGTAQLRLMQDEPDLAAGWFRRIVLQKNA